MKPININKCKIPARRIAEAMWGTGGTNSYRTNRKGAYYFSCSSHGGYVVDGRVLSEVEKENIERDIEPHYLNLLIREFEGEKDVVGVNLNDFTAYGKKSFKVDLHYTHYWEKLPVYLFEEDCAWCILEKHTNIRSKNDNPEWTPERHEKYIEETYRDWYSPEAKERKRKLNEEYRRKIQGA